MSFDQKPEQSITSNEALNRVIDYVSERAEAGVMMAEAFTKITLEDGVLAATWDEDAIGTTKSNTLLALNPFENLAQFIGTPLAFHNEDSHQVREHVHTVSVIGPFGVGSMSAQEIYELATGYGPGQP